MNFENARHELAVFEDLFFADVEKGFTARIACCDACYDEFLGQWPLAYSADKAAFQRAGIDVQTFYSGSRLRQEFSKEDFDRLMEQVNCPNCYAPLTGNFWPYELPFDLPADFTQHIKEIATLADDAPFLLLTHPLCRRIRNLVRKASDQIVSQVWDSPLYRARRINSGDIAATLESFDFPPRSVVKEGRYNHAGSPVLYLANDLTTCLKEMRDGRCLVATFQYSAPVRVLDFSSVASCNDEERELLNALAYSSLTSAPENELGWHKPKYVFTRFLADCARIANIDAIKYPSTRLSEIDGSYNLVVFNRELKLAKYADGATFTIHQVGPHADTIHA